MYDVLAVMVTVPLDPAGMVIPVLNVPVAVVLKEKVAEPTITVPVVDALKPVPDATTVEPAGPDAGFKTTCAAAAACAGWMKARAIPAATKRATTNVLTDRNKATILHVDVRPQPLILVRNALAQVLDVEPAVSSRNPQFSSETTFEYAEQP
jgi:hypothetical protein